jgi:LysM repeat protein
VKDAVNQLSMASRIYLFSVLLALLAACDGVLTPVPKPTLTPTVKRPSSSIGVTVTPTRIPGSLLTPIPPTPTYTPSPTPTPVIHIIERGDTLFGVALDYGVTLDALLYANGIEATDILRIGQALIIPIGEEEEYAPSGLQIPAGNMILPTPTPLPLEIRGLKLYHTPVGGAQCMGEVVNTTAEPVTNIQVAITLVTEDGAGLLTGYTLASADYLAPGERAPFSFLFAEPPDGAVDVDAQLFRGEEVSSITAGFVPLEIQEVEGTFSGPQYRVKGMIENNSEYTLGRISIVATIYDDKQNVIGYRHNILANDTILNPGQRQDFSLLLTPQIQGDVDNFQVIAWAVSQ